MKGTILEVSMQSSTGIITGENGNRYSFSFGQWRAQAAPRIGQQVDFVDHEDRAVEIYTVAASRGGGGIADVFEGDKNKTVAALLAILLGAFGAHKFYLGYKTAGIIMAALTLSGWLLSFVLIGVLWAWIPAVIGLVEGIIYLTKSDEDFEQIYIVGSKPWF